MSFYTDLRQYYSITLVGSFIRYSLYSAVSTICPECLTPHLTAITTIMVLALKSNEGITVRSIQATFNSLCTDV